jgi:cyclase
MDADGTQAGFGCELLRLVADAVPVPVIASGGAGTLQDFVDAAVQGHAAAVLAASVFHFGELTIGEVKAAMKAEGVTVR